MSFSTAEKIKRVKELRLESHTFLSPDGARYYAEPFGFKPHTFITGNTQSVKNPKGIKLRDNLQRAEGADAVNLALDIARHLGLNPPTWQMGRGFRMNTFCGAILEHLEKESNEVPDNG